MDGGMKNLMQGALAGAAGVAGMAGVITSSRRAILTSDQLADAKWHPEKVVEALAARAGHGELDDQTRRRLADLIHCGYGAIWDVVLTAATTDRPLSPARHGAPLAVALWMLGFGAVLRIGAHPPFWTWKPPRVRPHRGRPPHLGARHRNGVESPARRLKRSPRGLA